MRKLYLGALVALIGCVQRYPLPLEPLPIKASNATVHEISSNTIDSAGVKISKNTEFASEKSMLAVVAEQNLAVIGAARDIEVARAEAKRYSSYNGRWFGPGFYGDTYYPANPRFWGSRRIDSPRIRRIGQP